MKRVIAVNRRLIAFLVALLVTGVACGGPQSRIAAPELLSIRTAAIPSGSFLAPWEFAVPVEVLVNRSGAVDSVVAIGEFVVPRSSTERAFDLCAGPSMKVLIDSITVATARTAKFKPGSRNAEPFAARAAVWVVFNRGVRGSLPELIDMKAPEYPAFALERRAEGSITVRALVSEFGRVEDTAILVGDEEALNQAAMAAVRTAIFEPARLNGRAYGPIWICVKVDFDLFR